MRSVPLTLKGERKLLLGAGGVALLLWLSPQLQFAVLPLIYLNTHLHEIFHAVAAVVTGGIVAEIRVLGNGSGMTLTAGGIFPIISSAGYVGAAAFGAVMVAKGTTARGAKAVLLSLCIVIALGLILWVRGDLIGIASGVFWVGALIAIIKLATGAWLIFWAQFLGLTQCLAAAESLADLFFISRFRDAASDAHNMYVATGIPPLFWAIVWILFSAGVCVAALALAWRGSK